jgi:hypothetical protein
MFSLDKAVAEWHGKLAAAGIKPSSLDELEGHLREHIEQLRREGANAEEAFNASVQRMGEVHLLRSEFAKAEGFIGWLDRLKSTHTNRILAMLWLAGCGWSLNTVVRECVSRWPSIQNRGVSLYAMAALIYMCGIVGSALLFCGSRWGCRIVRMLAFLMATACSAQVFWILLRSHSLGQWSLWCSLVAVFSLLTIRLLHPPTGERPQPNTAAS